MDKVRQYNPLDMGYTGTAGKEPPQSIRIQSGVVDKGIKRRKAKGEPLNFNVLAGAILTGIDIIKDNGVDMILFYCKNKVYLQCHLQECSEGVGIEDICGDINDIISSPILMAEESISIGNQGEDHCTWTFYKLATNKGAITIRWAGCSNGYYSESVEFYLFKNTNRQERIPTN